MIIGAGMRLGGGPLRSLGGMNGYTTNFNNWASHGSRFNVHAGEGTRSGGVSISNTNGDPSGYRHPYTWNMPIKEGGIASRGRIVGTGEVTFANLAGGLNADAALSGSGNITNAALGLIVSLIADLVGSGTCSADILGKIEATADLTGTGDFTNAALGALASMLADLSGAGSASATAYASGDMSADIVVTGDLLNTGNVAEAVWGAVAEGTLTFAQVQRICLAVLAGKSNIAGTTVTFRDTEDTKDRVTATMTSSERTTVTLDGD